MSMILDALTRAEHERQLEKQPDLKFVTPVNPQQKKSTMPSWMWIGLVILANVIILAIFLRPESNTQVATNPEVHNSAATEMAMNSIAKETTEPVEEPVLLAADQHEMSKDTPVEPLNQELNNSLEPVSTTQSSTTRPLAMELERATAQNVDRPLIYETKQSKSPTQTAQNNTAAVLEKDTQAPVKKGAVSFSQTELSIDKDAQPVANTPKLLIDEEETDQAATVAALSSVPSLKDLPESSRSNLKQYEVNVHVFDDNPDRRFVLINMDKYKEGDRIANNGPLVQEITRDGVIVDYGAGRALMPPK